MSSLNHASWGTKIKATRIGMWGHDAYTKDFTYSGAKGHYPNTVYRFSLYGNASIDKDEYSDIEIKESEFQVGAKTCGYRIDKIFESGKEEVGVHVCKETPLAKALDELYSKILFECCKTCGEQTKPLPPDGISFCETCDCIVEGNTEFRKIENE